MKTANIDREFLHIFRTTWGNLMKFSVKKRLDTSDKFYDQFGSRDVKLKKEVGLYAVESIDNPNRPKRVCRRR